MIASTIEKGISIFETGYSVQSDILSDSILSDFITRRNKKSLRDLRGKITFRDDYDYKTMRS